MTLPRLSFRLRLALFFVATLVTVQVLTAGLAYEVARRQLLVEGGRQLTAMAAAFTAQMNDISVRVAAGVQILSQDYGLRSAIGERDRDTVLSILRNNARRVAATRMQLVGLDGNVQADTDGDAARAFAYPELILGAADKRKAAVVATDNQAFWVVAVPINAPQPIGMVVASIPLDDTLLGHMQQLSALPRDVELVTQDAGKPWRTVARGSSHSDLAAGYQRSHRDLPLTPVLATIGNREYLVLARPFAPPRGSAAVAAVLAYPLDDALRPYRSVWLAWGILFALGLAVGLVGAWLTARSISRPVEALVGAVRRIEAGDYDAPVNIQRHDEIGQLGASFQAMTAAVRDREQRILYQALHDPVTGLPNRLAVEQAVDQAPQPVESALLMVGVTRHADIIKTMGHALADRLMHEVGERIARTAAGAFVGRATDTQFVVWLAGADKAQAIALGFRLLDALNAAYQEADVSIDIGPAIGTALAPHDGRQASVLLRHAEVALFAATGTTTAIDFYQPENDPHQPQRLSLMGELRSAIGSEQLALHYQPKLNLATGVVDGAEALIRWQHPRRGTVSPDEFIGVAEATGNIGRLTRWVLSDALARARVWLDQGRALQLAINLSARDLEDTDLVRRLADLLALHRVPAACITLEVTESAMIADPTRALDVLNRLAELGLHMAIDDFGVGQSSFAYLRQMPVHELKIDKTFVTHLGENEGDRIIVRSIVELGHRLGFKVTAEGAENDTTLAFLRSVGCDHAQGWFIAAALPVHQFEALLADGASP
jgi:diguanylate cyclase (GGDEF)-like protein